MSVENSYFKLQSALNPHKFDGSLKQKPPSNLRFLICGAKSGAVC